MSEQLPTSEEVLMRFARMVRDLPYRQCDGPARLIIRGETHVGPVSSWFVDEFMPALRQMATEVVELAEQLKDAPDEG